MVLTGSKSGLFSTPGFIVSPVGKEGGEGGRKEEGIKKYRRKEKTEF